MKNSKGVTTTTKTIIIIIIKIPENYGSSILRLCFFFYLAVNKPITDDKQFIFSLIAEHSGFIKFSLSKVDEMIQINGIFSTQHRGKCFGETQCLIDFNGMSTSVGLC